MEQSKIELLVRDYQELKSYRKVAEKHGMSAEGVRYHVKNRVILPRDQEECIFCGNKARKDGRTPTGKQRYFCPHCNKHFVERELRKRGTKPIGSKPMSNADRQSKWYDTHHRVDSTI